MKTKIVMMDCENRQPDDEDLALLKDGEFMVRVFLGTTQPKIRRELAAALQPLGKQAEYVFVEASGKNALDFVIAFYIGTLSSQVPTSSFYIISKDTGFDPLIKHLNSIGVQVERFKRIADIPISDAASPTKKEDIDC